MTVAQFKLITFDGDGTLWDFESAMLSALDHAAQQMTRWNLQINGHDPSRADLLADREAVGREHTGAGLTMERLRWLRLGDMFNVVTVAQECQLWKPDPRIFQLPLAQLRLHPHQAVHVGDHQRHDIHGASGAGMRTVWVNRRAACKAEWCAPDAEIRSLAELPFVLDHLEHARAGC